MENQNFTVTLKVKQTPAEVFKAIVNPRGWWSEEIVGGTAKTGDIFDYHFEDIHRCKMELTQVVPDTKVVWLVLENYFKPGIFGEAANNKHNGKIFAGDKAEWVDTNIIFNISEKDGMTELTFTHEGLVPDYECYEICVNGWTHYIRESLYGLITSGVGKPNASERPMTADEEKIKASSAAN